MPTCASPDERDQRTRSVGSVQQLEAGELDQAINGAIPPQKNEAVGQLLLCADEDAQSGAAEERDTGRIE